MPQTQEEIIKYYKNKLAPQEKQDDSRIANLLEYITDFPGTPMFNQKPPDTQALTPNAVSTIIPDTGKIKNNLQKNELMAQFPGLGAK